MVGAAVGEEHEVLLVEVLDDTHLVAADVELFVEGVDDVSWLCVMAIAVELANRHLTKQSLPLVLDCPSRRDRADRKVRSGAWAARVHRHGGKLASCCLQVVANGATSSSLVDVGVVLLSFK